jgi:hypothetical protein
MSPVQPLTQPRWRRSTRKHLAERRRIERDLKLLHEQTAGQLVLLSSEIGPAKQAADTAVDALAQARVDRKALDQLPLLKCRRPLPR